MKRRIFMCWAFLLLVACYPGPPNMRENLLVNKTFVYLLYTSEQECIENQPEPDFFFNCHQQIDFYKNKVVEIMLTDIIWRGSYRIENQQVILKFESSYEIPEGELIFDIIHPDKLFLTNNETIWKKVKGNSIWE